MSAGRGSNLGTIALLAALAGCAGSSPCEARRAEAPHQGVVFRDETDAFVVTRAKFVLDGKVLADVHEVPDRPVPEALHVLPHSPPPGAHELKVLIQLRGNGYGVFSYLREYRFEVRSSHRFTVSDARPLRLEVMAWEQGDLLTPLEQRATVCYAEL